MGGKTAGGGGEGVVVEDVVGVWEGVMAEGEGDGLRGGETALD